MDTQNKKFYIFLSFAALAIFYIMNILTYFCMDDYCYMFDFSDKGVPISLSNIFSSLAIHYQKVNGRIITHFFAHLFCSMNKGVFNVINTFAFALLCGVSCYHSELKITPKRFFFVILGFWFLTPAFGESFLWVTGSSNYLWGLLIAVSYMIPLRYGMENKFRNPLLMCVYSFFGGIIAGWTNENIAAAMCVFICLWIIYTLIKEHKAPLFYVCALLGVTAGLLAMILSPGHGTRLDANGGTGSVTEIILRMLPITEKLIIYLFPFLIVQIILLVVFLRKNGLKSCEKLVPWAIFFVTALSSAYSMATSPYFPDRVWSGTVCFMIIAVLVLYDAVKIRFTSKTAAALLISVFVLFSCYEGYNLNVTKQKFLQREEAAHQALKQGKKDLYLNSVKGSGTRFDPQNTEGDIINDKNSWMNVALSYYWRAESVNEVVK